MARFRIKVFPTTRREWRRAAAAAVITLSPVAVLLLYFAIVVVPMPGRSARGAVVPVESDSARAERMRDTVQHLAVGIGTRDAVEMHGLREARDFVALRWEELGYATSLRTYEIVEGEVSNVEAERLGTTAPDEIVIIGAHYDTAPGTPGANDNATGVAALIELAEVFSEQDTGRTLRFVAFVNEEPPFFDTDEMGSAVYAAETHARGEDVVAMISLETLGWYDQAPGSQQYPPPFGLFYPSRGDFVALVGNVRSRSFVRWAVGEFRETGRVPSQGAAAPGRLPGVYWSDHAPFWEYGWPALMVTDTAPFRYAHYHRPTDLPARIDHATLAAVVDGLVPVIAALVAADGPRF